MLGRSKDTKLFTKGMLALSLTVPFWPVFLLRWGVYVPWLMCTTWLLLTTFHLPLPSVPRSSYFTPIQLRAGILWYCVTTTLVGMKRLCT